MRALELNLATRPFRNNMLPWIGLLLASAALVAFTTWNVRTYRLNTMLYEDLVAQYGTIEQQHADLERRDEKAERERKKHDLPSLGVRAEKANEVIRWKAFSWTRLFNLLQEVQPYNVQMTSVHPVFRPSEGGAEHSAIDDPEKVPVAVEGVAKSVPDFFALQRSLTADPHFDRVEPERIQHVAEGREETVFRIRFLYDPRVGETPDPAATAALAEGAAGPDVAEPVVVEEGSEIAAEGWDRPGLEGDQ